MLQWWEYVALLVYKDFNIYKVAVVSLSKVEITDMPKKKNTNTSILTEA